MSNLFSFFKGPFKSILYGLFVLASCQSSTSESTDANIERGEENPRADSDQVGPAAADLSEGNASIALQAAYARALRLAEQGDPATLPLCDSLLANQGDGGGAEPYYYKGIYFETKKEPLKAIGWFDKTIQTDYSFYEAYIEKASLLMELKQYEPARKELELLRTLSPGYAPVHYWLGKWAVQQQQIEKAQQHFRLALSLDPSLTEAKEALERLEK
jgi:tetratricopeptide (TPR) repeat protein